MSSKLALKTYTAPNGLDAPKPLSVAKKKKVKDRIKAILEGKVLDQRKVVHRAVYDCPRKDDVAITVGQVHEVLAEMAIAGEFAPGFGGIEEAPAPIAESTEPE